MRHARPALAILGAVACTACRAVPDPTPRTIGLELPPDYTAADAADGAPPDLWWRTFDAPELTAAVEAALLHNRDLGAAVARVDAAVAHAAIAGAELWPRATAGTDLERRRLNFIGLPIPGRSDVLNVTTNQFALSLDLAWEIDLWGRVRAGELAAEADLAAAVADLRAARLSIAGRTAQVWLAAVEATQQLALAEETATTFRSIAELVERRFEAGVRPALDLRLARADQAQADAVVVQRGRQRDELLRQLQVLTGSYPDASITPGTQLPAVPPPVPAGLPVDLLERRSDVVAAERHLAAADARLAQARADLWPRLSLTASGGTSSAELEDLVDLDFRVWSIGANVLAPLFEGGRRRANVALHDAQRLAALSEFAATVLQALREVETALFAEAALADEVARRTAAADAATAAYELSQERYDRGLVDITTLLTAQRGAVAARTQLLAARRERLDNRIDLLLALGGGLPPHPPVDPGDRR